MTAGLQKVRERLDSSAGRAGGPRTIKTDIKSTQQQQTTKEKYSNEH
jgi:hypothetical protein